MLKDMTVKTELIIAIGLLSVILIGIGMLGLNGIKQSNEELRTVYQDRTVTAVDQATINDIWEAVRKNMTIAASTKSTEFAKEKSEETAKTIKRAEEIWARFMVTELTTVEEQLAQEKLRLHAAYVAAVNKIFAMTIAGDFDGAAKNLKDEAELLFYRLHETIYSMISLQGKVATEEYESAVNDYSSIFMIMIATISSSVLLACALGYILLRVIVKPLNEAITIANAVAAGDLSTRIEPRSTVNGYLAA